MADDLELVAAALAGGPEAFTAIVQRYQDAVFGIAVARLGNFHDAQDVAQQVFVEAFQSLRSLRDPRRLGPWLRSMTICRCVDRLRGRRRTAPLESGMRASPEPDPHEQIERREVRERVLEAIGGLSNALRETVTLYYVSGYSLAEVAAIQGVPEGTVKRRLHDGRGKLREELIGMVENVLKSEAPKEDFAKRVFDILCQRPAHGRHPYAHLGWRQTVEELRQICGKGLDGFIQALDSPHSPTRVLAVHMLEQHNAPTDAEAIVQLLLRSLSDPNRKVRRHAVEALLCSDQPAERKREEFVPRIVPMLEDRSIRVRRHAAYELCDWWRDVPLEAAARAMLNDKDGEARKRLTALVCRIIHGDQER